MYRIAYRGPTLARLLPGQWLDVAAQPNEGFRDVVKAREAVRALRRFWPWCAFFIIYPPVED